ncbi:MAG: GDSL-type esterase/lipase family protein [Tetrasphaera sp.]
MSYESRLAIPQNGLIVFPGDSITETGRTPGAGDLGIGYVAMVACRFPGVRVINAGVGGDRVSDLRRRWPRDVLSHEADLVSVFIGINDTWCQCEGGIASPYAAYETDYRALLEPLADRGVRLVLVEPVVVVVEPGQERWLPDVRRRQQIAADLAGEFGATLVPLAAPLAALAARIGPSAVAEDGVHPTSAGHRAIADAWFAAVWPS